MTTDRYTFDAVVHARPQAAPLGPTFTLRGLQLPTLALAPAEFAGFERTFEEVGAELERFERMYFEPDGSFVWVASDGAGDHGERRQLDGMLYDRAGHVLHMELKGVCSATELERVAAALGRPTSELVFQLTREALYLDDAAFRRYAAAGE